MTEVFDWRSAPPAEYAVIGDPVHHSLSPRMHTAAFEALGLRERYVAVHITPEEVGEALDHLRELGYRGINVTVPHKLAALEWSVKKDPFAVRANAANTLRLQDRACINTDGPGFMETVRQAGVSGSEVLMLGAGGSARAVALALVEGGFHVQVWNRTRARAEELCAMVGYGCSVASLPVLAGYALILNTTSASLSGDRLPIDWKQADPETLAYDLAYGDGPTPFLQDAREFGIRGLDGRALLVEQGALSFEWWHGGEAPREAMRRAIG